MKKLFYIFLLFLFTGATEKEKTTIATRSFYAEMKALEKPDRVNAFGFVQASNFGSVNSNQIVLTVSATTQYNLVVVAIYWRGTEAGTVTAISDNAGNTYEIGTQYTAGHRKCYLSYGIQTTGGATSITIDMSSSGLRVAEAAIFSGFGNASNNTNVFDVRAEATGSSTTPSLSLSPSASGELIVASVMTLIGGTATAGTDYTLTKSANQRIQNEYRLSGTTSETAPMTTTATDWNEIAIAFKDGGSSATNTTNFFKFFNP